MFEMSLGENPTRGQRAARGWLFGAAWMYPGMAWMWSLTPPGYLLAAAIYAGYHSVAALGVAHWAMASDRTARRAHTGRGLAVGVSLRRRSIGDAPDRPSRWRLRRHGARRWRVVADVGGVPDRVRTRRPVTVRAADGSSARAGRQGRVARRDRRRHCDRNPDPRGSRSRPARTPHNPLRCESRSCRAVGRRAHEPSTPIRVKSSNATSRPHVRIKPGSTDLVVWPENVVDVAVVRRQPGGRGGGSRGSAHRRTVRSGHHRGRARRSLPQRASPDRHERRDHRPLRQGASRALRRVHADARIAARRSARRPISCRATRSPALVLHTSTSRPREERCELRS